MPIRERRLVAILATDACNYSALMTENEDQTINSFEACRTLILKSIASKKGKVFNTAGDSLHAEFGSVVQAVSSAVEFQDQIKSRNLTTASNDQMEFRVGIHLGDITEGENNHYGDGINIASRLESIAKGGGNIYFRGRV